MIRRLGLAAALALSAFAPAFAQDGAAMSPNLSPSFVSCLGRASGNAVQTSVCAQREMGAQDDRLNKAYQRVMRQLASDPAGHAALRDEERRWLSARDYACKVNDQTVDQKCLVLRTAGRADELESRVRF